MIISDDKIEKTREIIRSLYTLPCSASSIALELAALQSLINADYNAVLILPSAQQKDATILSNNPSGYIDVYKTVIHEDFLMEAIIEKNSAYIMARDPSFNIPEHMHFIDTVQQSRPISDIMYMPIRTNKALFGHFAIGRAGLSSPFFSDEEVNLFLFIAPFIADFLAHSLDLGPPPEFGAYVDYQGNAVVAGARFRKLGLVNAALYSLIQTAYLRFLHGQLEPGMNQLSLSVGSKTYSVHFSLLPATDLRTQSTGIPFASVDILEPLMPDVSEKPFTSIKWLDPYGLTLREKQVVEELYRGLSNKSIALKLGVDESTIKRHTHNIYEKTGFGSRVELLLGIKADK